MRGRAIIGVVVVASLLALRPGDLVAQRLPIGDTFEDYVRVIQLIGGVDAAGFNIRPVHVPHIDSTVDHPWQHHFSPYEPDSASRDLRFVSPAASFGWVASRPAGGNDGFLWQGRGLNTVWRAGVFGRYTIFSRAEFAAAFRPAFAYVQNADFNAGPGSAFHYFGRNNIDAPRRFGEDPLIQFNPGESFVELSLFGAAVGASTENMWWGPSTQNAIVMSNNGPGFKHLYLRTSRMINTGFMDVGAKWFWGNLYESSYFDEDPANDRRFITAIAFELQPHFIPSLYFGATRIFVQATDEEPTRFRDYLIVFQSPLKADLEDTHDDYGFDKNDQMASAFARWVFPESGFGVYAEIARGDHSRDLRHVFAQIKFATAYTIGLNKVGRLGDDHLLKVNAEITRLEASKSDIIRSGIRTSHTNFYVNTIVRQGYTHRGQLLGASIGPGSNSQHLGIDLYGSWGSARWYGKRVVHDNDLFYGVSGDPTAHQVELITGLGGLLFHHPFEITADVSLRRFHNLFYMTGNDRWNFSASAGFRWAIGNYR